MNNLFTAETFIKMFNLIWNLYCTFEVIRVLVIWQDTRINQPWIKSDVQTYILKLNS